MSDIIHADGDPVVEQWRKAVATLARLEALADSWTCEGPWTDHPDIDQIGWRVLHTAGAEIRRVLNDE